MSRRIHHMGMTVTRDDHTQFHTSPKELSSRQHAGLMKRMGITKEQDEAWHRTHFTLAEQRAKGLKRIDPLAAGADFLTWCVKQGLLIQKGQDYFASKEGARQLHERFDLTL